MQGRLSASETGALQEFPRREWEAEFARAAAAGLGAIEWLYDEYEANPLETENGIARMRELAAEHGVEVRSLCAHRLVQRRGLDVDHLLDRCARAGIEIVVLPFLDGCEIRTELFRPGFVIESDLEPSRLADLRLPVSYDTGNARGRGIDVIGPLIRHVHVKDVDEAGTNVPLGEGTVDFPAVFATLRAIGYDGELVLETPRPRPGEEVALARRQVAFVQEHLR
jgi:hypothetical protein